MKFLFIDLFCGAGGTTIGIEQSVDINGNRIAKVIAAVNHDHKAIESHWKNHPEVVHFEEDIRTLELSGLVKIAKDQQKMYPDAILVLWASLECTMVLLGQAEPMQIFLPFVYDMKKNETFYQKVLSGKPTLLLG